MPGQWNSHNLQKVTSLTNPLVSAVLDLNPKTKQAMYAAAIKGPIVKRNWNGCAFNVAGAIEGKYVSSVAMAEEAFGLAYSTVSSFITAWDGGTETTEDLIKILLEVGLYTEAGEAKPKRGNGLNRVSFRKYTSWETRMKEDLDFNIEQDTLPVGTQEAAELVFAGV